MRISSPVVLALLCVVVWSFIPVVSRVGQLNIDSFQFLFWTNLFSTVAVGLTINLKKCTLISVVKNTNYKFTMVLGFLGCFFYYLCLYYGYAHANSIEVLVVQYTWPALTAIIATILLNEKFNLSKLLSIFIGLMATLLVITKGDFSNVDFSDSAVLSIVFIGAISFALFSAISKKERRYDVSFSIFMYFFWASIFSLIALLVWSELLIPDTRSLFVIGINGVIINGLSYILWINALSKAEASKIAPLVYISPVLSVIWVTLFFQEDFTLIYSIAVVLAIFSGLLVVRQDVNKVKSNNT